MKKSLLLIVAAAALAMSAGCAHKPTFGVPSDQVEVVDYRKMQLIEEEARRTGVQVLWIRKPTKLVARNTLL